MANTLVIQKDINAYDDHINQHLTRRDTDSTKNVIDNLCSACIFQKIDYFIVPLKDIKRSIKGFGGERVYNVKLGKIKYKCCDYQGKEFNFCIPNSYYVSNIKIRLLSH